MIERTFFISPTNFCARSGLVQKSGCSWSASISWKRFRLVAKSKTLLELFEAAEEGGGAGLEVLERGHEGGEDTVWIARVLGSCCAYFGLRVPGSVAPSIPDRVGVKLGRAD
jgi:hypothetical protein